jgi:L,D-transpeptidase catalytic domain
MRLRIAVALMCVAAVAGAAAPPTRSVDVPDQVLSDETTTTRWAHVERIVPIRRAPDAAAPRVAALRWLTGDGFPSIYLVLRMRVVGDAQWLKIRVPGRPNGRTGWVPRDALGPLHLTHRLLVVDRRHLRMGFYDNGRRIWTAPVGVGKPGTPTPAGHFWIDERFRIADARSGYYPYAFGTTAYSRLSDWPGGGIVGIHGPYFEPQRIPGRISHGCIRLKTADTFWLARHLRLGTPVHVV